MISAERRKPLPPPNGAISPKLAQVIVETHVLIERLRNELGLERRKENGSDPGQHNGPTR